MAHITNEAYLESLKPSRLRTEMLTERQEIEKRLSRMLVCPIARIHNRCAREVLCCEVWRAAL
jgi:hypothetical protein